jgi:uncharacterized protein YkwD
MFQLLKALALLTLLALGAIFVVRTDVAGVIPPDIEKYIPAADSIDTVAPPSKAEPKVSAPPPLRAATTGSPDALLTKNGTISWTNAQRVDNNLPPLKENTLLNAAAAAKANDMFAKQYFAHVSPAGTGPSDLAKNAGYEFIAVGENLALGNFDGDKALVQAWMDSPGHRANILRAQYEEIGVAVVQGIYEGHKTWIAVQEFGRPLSSCPQPDEALKTTIETNQNILDEWQKALDVQKAQLDAMRPKRGFEYNQKVNEYNDFVNRYNALVAETKPLIIQYNTQTETFNACVKQ